MSRFLEKCWKIFVTSSDLYKCTYTGVCLFFFFNILFVKEVDWSDLLPGEPSGSHEHLLINIFLRFYDDMLRNVLLSEQTGPRSLRCISKGCTLCLWCFVVNHLWWLYLNNDPMIQKPYTHVPRCLVKRCRLNHSCLTISVPSLVWTDSVQHVRIPSVFISLCFYGGKNG